MRDFRDAKAMAQTVRDALKSKSISVTHSECLELISKAFGFHDWNELSAKIVQSGGEPTPIKIPANRLIWKRWERDRPIVPLPAGADLPVVPMRDIVLFPMAATTIFVDREKSKRALYCAMAADRRFVAVTQRRPSDIDPTPEALYGVGVIAVVSDVLPLPDGSIKSLIRSCERVIVARLIEGDVLAAMVTPFVETLGDSTRGETLVKAVLERSESYFDAPVSSWPYGRLKGIREPGDLADAVAPLLSIEIGQRQELLETGDAIARLEKVLALMEDGRRAVNPPASHSRLKLE